MGNVIGGDNSKKEQPEKYALLKQALAHFGFQEEDLFNRKKISTISKRKTS